MAPTGLVSAVGVLENALPVRLGAVSVEVLAGKFVAVFVVWVLAKLVIRLIRKSIRKADQFVEPADIDVSTLKLIDRFIAYFVYFVALLFVLWMFNLTPAVYSLLTAAGFIGIVFGFGLANILQNFVAGVILAFEQPFRIGEAIQVRDIGGKVEDMRIRRTTIKTWDGRIVYVPSTVLLGEVVTNYTRSKLRRIALTFQVSYESDLQKAVGILKEMVDSDGAILKEPGSSILVDYFGDYAVGLKVMFWIDTQETGLFGKQSDFRTEVKRRFGEEGIDIPYPTQVMIQGK